MAIKEYNVRPTDITFNQGALNTHGRLRFRKVICAHTCLEQAVSNAQELLPVFKSICFAAIGSAISTTQPSGPNRYIHPCHMSLSYLHVYMSTSSLLQRHLNLLPVLGG